MCVDFTITVNNKRDFSVFSIGFYYNRILLRSTTLNLDVRILEVLQTKILNSKLNILYEIEDFKVKCGIKNVKAPGFFRMNIMDERYRSSE